MAIIIPVAAVVSFAVFFTSAHGGNTCDTCQCSLSNVDFITDLIDKTINATVTPRLEEFSATFEERMEATVMKLNFDEKLSTVSNALNAVNGTVDERITTVSTKVDAQNVKITRLSTKPVMAMLYITLSGDPHRSVTLRPVNATTHVLGSIISSMTIPDHSSPYTSLDNVLAYHPYHGSNNTAIIFINLEAAIPCYSANEIAPVCNLFTPDSFQTGKTFVQAADIGNHFQVFSNNQSIATYGFGVAGCPIFNTVCESSFNASMVCLLPPGLNDCGI